MTAHEHYRAAAFFVSLSECGRRRISRGKFTSGLINQASRGYRTPRAGASISRLVRDPIEEG